MATRSTIGTIRISIDGDWDISDLGALSDSLAETYGLFYPLVAPDEVLRERLHDSLRKTFWSGDTDMRFVGSRLYRSIPGEESLKLKSFHYSSPGHLEIMGVLAVLYLMGRVAKMWTLVGDHIFELWVKVDKYFSDRRHLRRPRKSFELDKNMSLDSDEARALVFEIGGRLGFSDESCDALIGVIGNPISALKFLVVVGREGRKLANLQAEGKLTLPTPGSDEIVIRSSLTSKNRPKGS